MTRRRRIGVMATVLVAVLTTLGWLLAQAVLAWWYAYPLIIMDITREQSVQTLGPPNRLVRVRQFPDASFKAVVRPNVDTLYTVAHIDMAEGPWVFTMGSNDARFEVMSFLDAWTDVFAAPGTRTTGTQGGRFWLAGPGWSGSVPAGMTLLRAPTRHVWLIGRTQALGRDDLPTVHRLQDGLTLRRWDEAQAPPPEPASGRASGPRVAPGPAPVALMETLPMTVLYQRFARAWRDNPARPDDAPMVDRLARLGIRAGEPVVPSAWQTFWWSAGRTVGNAILRHQLAHPRPLVQGWATPPVTLGQYGTNHALRAAVAMAGLGANLAEDAIYPHARVDTTGQPLNGSQRYRLHFPAGQLPPVRAFWSVTVYGIDDALQDNPVGRFALGSSDPLQFNPDGSLDLWVQSTPPAPHLRSNWLPVRAGEPFLLNARLYWPMPAALSGQWHMPGIERQP